jgi:DNA-binding transcriptional MerR regulator
MGTLTIGQLAKKAQVNVETVRYYERGDFYPRAASKAVWLQTVLRE